MIGFLSGIHRKTLPIGLVLEVAGVGYCLETPLSTLASIPSEGQSVSLWVHTLVREDSIRLFGFGDYEEKVVFETLLSLNGVGPKVALAMLSTIGVEGIRHATQSERLDRLRAVPGIGPRLAEKILVELKSKYEKLFDHAGSVEMLVLAQQSSRKGGVAHNPMGLALTELRSALENLGFKDKVIAPIIKNLGERDDLGDLKSLLKVALNMLTKGPAVETNNDHDLDKVF